MTALFHSPTPSEISSTLRELDRAPRKDRGQNFLHGTNVISRTLGACGLTHEDRVLEIGPGLGTFTFNLVSRVDHVVAIEIDEKLKKYLEKTAATLGIKNLDVHLADALETDFSKGHTFIFSAMPYSIAGPLAIKIMITLATTGARAGLICQKEFADKMLAPPGSTKYSRFSINTRFLASITRVMEISRNNFIPIPKVDSTFVLAEPIPRKQQEIDSFIETTRYMFPHLNKTVRKAMKIYLKHGKGDITRDLDDLPHACERVRELDISKVKDLVSWLDGGLNDGR